MALGAAASSRPALLGLLGLLVVLAACGSDKPATAGGASGSAPLAVAITANGCDPAKLDAAAGQVTFAVTNKTDSRAEFEILSSAPQILAEEFLEAGKSGHYTVTLPAGQYQVICGAPSDPRADLVVTGEGGQAPAAASKVDQAALSVAVAAYTTYVNEQTAKLAAGTKAFTDAVRAGHVDQAKSLYAGTRIPWEEIEPVAELFPDADAVIDSRADDFQQAEADPEFSGFHAIEYGLWAQGSKDGHMADLSALADRLDTDVTSLIGEVAKITITPQVMTNGAAGLIEEAARTKITGEEERYSRTDLVTLAANVDGARKIVDLLRPVLQPVDADLQASIDGSLKKVDGILATLKSGDTYVSYDQVTDAQRNDLKSSMAQLSEELSQLSGALGLEVKE